MAVSLSGWCVLADTIECTDCCRCFDLENLELEELKDAARGEGLGECCREDGDPDADDWNDDDHDDDDWECLPVVEDDGDCPF